MYRTLLLATLLAAMLAAGSPSPLPLDVSRMTQEATPALTFPVTPDPTECTVEPRPAEALLALLGTPTASQVPPNEAPVSEPSVIEVPIGRPANADIQESITATIYDLHACFNAGDSRRAFALTTDAFLQNFGNRESLTSEDIAFLIAESVPVPAEFRPVLLAVTDVTVLPSGQVGAFVVTDNAFTGPDTVHMTFTRQGERWLVDEIIEFVEA